MTNRYANNLIASTKTVDNLGTIVPKPATESQARPLATLPPEKQRGVWREAVETAPEGDGNRGKVRRSDLETIEARSIERSFNVGQI